MGGALGCPSRKGWSSLYVQQGGDNTPAVSYKCMMTEDEKLRDGGDIDYIKQLIEKLNGPETTEKAKNFSIQELLKKGCFVGKYIGDQIYSIQHQESRGPDLIIIEEVGDFDERYHLLSGSKSIQKSRKIGDNKELSATSCYEVRSGKESLRSYVMRCGDKTNSFRGEFETRDGVDYLKNGEIQYEQEGHYTIIKVRDGHITSILDYSKKDGESREVYIDFKTKEESYITYYGEKTETYYASKIVNALILPNNLSFQPQDLSRIDQFREELLSQNYAKNRLKLIKQSKKPQYQLEAEDQRDIDSLVQGIEGVGSEKEIGFVRQAISNLSDKRGGQKVESSMPQLQDGDWEDADEVIRDWYQQQREINISTKDSKKRPKTVSISKASKMDELERTRSEEIELAQTRSQEELAQTIPQELEQFAQTVVQSLMPQMKDIYAPDEPSLPHTFSSPSGDCPPTPSPALPRYPDFYGVFEKNVLTEILHAVTFFLKEEERRVEDCYELKREYYYHLLCSITDHSNFNPVGLDELCKGLVLTETQATTLTTRLLDISREKFSSPYVQDCVRQRALETAFDRATKACREAENCYNRPEALEQQGRELE